MNLKPKQCINSQCPSIMYVQPHRMHLSLQCEDCVDAMHARLKEMESWSKFDDNGWNTNLLTLNVMERVADWTGLDIHNDKVSDELYWICCDLQDWPEGEGFGSSDHYIYYVRAMQVFHITPEDANELSKKVRA